MESNNSRTQRVNGDTEGNKQAVQWLCIDFVLVNMKPAQN
jgi:hypothetical protein